MEDLNISKEYYDNVMENKNKEEFEHLTPAFVMVTLFMIVGLPGNLFVIVVYYPHVFIGKKILSRKHFGSFRKRSYLPECKSSTIYESENGVFSSSYNSEAILDEASRVNKLSLRRQVWINVEKSTRNIVKSTIPNNNGYINLMTFHVASSALGQRPSGTCLDDESCFRLNTFDILLSESDVVTHHTLQSH
ncbi:hypothetical protein CHS0354_037070 [Potamilus streckersoni]|uniref:Uncharacterized protein n=1 Tax=Potamilus streckersoni TaxID=2493646 RepID=A0AAE0VZE9_9BIVA|nr:hypothetical protein CHS0354_037070 [Potamilus streckersoni]